jgi:hypothetical protein
MLLRKLNKSRCSFYYILKEILEVENHYFVIRKLMSSSEFHKNGGLAQLARAPALHAGGHRFDSDILHQDSYFIVVIILRYKGYSF